MYIGWEMKDRKWGVDLRGRRGLVNLIWFIQAHLLFLSSHEPFLSVTTFHSLKSHSLSYVLVPGGTKTTCFKSKVARRQATFLTAKMKRAIVCRNVLEIQKRFNNGVNF